MDRAAELDNSSTGSDAAIELASFWLNRCTARHDKCQPSSRVSETSFVPTRLLDVKGDAIRIIETKNEIQGKAAERRFVALSHCWGKTPIIRTLNENYQDFLKNIDPDSLSKTFREAVYATRRLNFRYLWIDSLCIIQNNDADWGSEAATMCNVYSSATLTIAAAHAPEGNVGCFEERDGILQFPFIVDVPLPGPGTLGTKSTRRARIQFTSYGRSKGLNSPEPPLYGRAWVLQEQLLSPRMLIFDGEQLRWECLSTHGSERSPQGGMTRHDGHHRAIRKGVMDDTEFFDLPEYEDRDFAARAQHQYWCYAVIDYTHRGMTKPSDRLVAIDGIAGALRRKTKQVYLAGLWSGHFWIGLLWSISHRNEYTPTTMRAFNLEENHHVRHKEPLSPSWSWASVTVPVVYPSPAVMFVHRICKLIDMRTAGDAAKQTGRVEIRGHVRTGYVNAIYPYSIREAAKAVPDMACGKPTGSSDKFTWHGRSFAPNDFFIFSDSKPTASGNQILSSNWRLVRGTWRPDQIIDPGTEITFLAIAQQNTGTKEGYVRRRYDEQHPLQTYAIGLVPTRRAEGEYTRVGYAVWEDCAWYEYMCGHKSRAGREISRIDGWRGMLAGWDLENTPMADGGGVHEHRFKPDNLPDMKIYHAGTSVAEKVVIIV